MMPDRLQSVEKSQGDFMISLIEKFISAGENQAVANKELALRIVNLQTEMANLSSKIEAFLTYIKDRPCVSGDAIKKVMELSDIEKKKTDELKNACKDCVVAKQDKSLKKYESMYSKIVAALIGLATAGSTLMFFLLRNGNKP